MVDNVYLALDNLLQWSMLQRQSLLTRPSLVDLAELTEAVVRLYHTELYQKHLKLTTHFEPTPVLVDEMQLHVVVRNLLHNAIKFTPPGGAIQICTHQSNGHISLTIIDSGVGLSFDRPDSATNQVFPGRGTAGERGTGLGLELCREFIRLNNGQLIMDSELNKGTTVTIRFNEATV